jgi:putative hydrolase of the HAD superfamily
VNVDLVVFDLGGVVVRICRSIGEAGKLVGIDVPDDLLTPEARAARKALHRDYERGLLACETFFARAAETTGGRLTPEQFRAMHLAWITGEYEGVGPLIDELHAVGLDTGVLSNTNASHWSQMQEDDGPHGPLFPSARKPRHRHASHLLGLAKPDAAIYRAFADRVAAARGAPLDPARIVFFDDLPENVEAARAQGWHAHRIDHTASPAQQMRRLLREAHGVPLRQD